MRKTILSNCVKRIINTLINTIAVHLTVQAYTVS